MALLVELSNARKSEALFSSRVDLGQLCKSIEAYRIEYGKFPDIGTEGSIETESSYTKLVLTLIGKDMSENPRGKVFLRIPRTHRRQQLDTRLIDPWGNFYRVRLDSDGDGFVASPMSDGPQVIAQPVIGWTLGPDGKLDSFDSRTWSFERNPEQQVVFAAGSFERQYGRMPGNWDEIGSIIDLGRLNRTSSRYYEIQQQYQFVQSPLPMLENEGSGSELEANSRILLARTESFRKANDKILYRSFIYRRSDGRFAPATIPETKVELLQSLAGMKLNFSRSGP